MDNHSSVLAWFLFSASMCNSQSFDGKAFASSLVEYFSIHHVIFLRSMKGVDYYMNAHKSLSQDLLYTSTLSYEDVTEIAKRQLVYYINSLVIVYSNDSDFEKSDLIKISNEMDMSLFKWVLITNKYDPKDYEKLQIPFNCQFVIAEHSESDGYVLTEIYDTLTVSKLSNHLGKWSAKNGLEFNGLGYFDRRKNLNNTVFNISSNHEDPCSIQSFAEIAGSVLKCIHYCTFPILAEMHNFSINWVVVNRSGGFGLEVLPPSVQFSLFEVGGFVDDSISLIWPTMKIPLDIYTGYTGQGYGWFTFVYPFSKEMWIAILVWFLASATIISTVELKFMNITRRKRGQMNLRLWLGYIFSSFSAFCNQSEGTDPDRMSLRILLYLMFLTPAALVPGYSAALTSHLAVKIERMPFTNLEGLSKAKDYRLGFHATFNLSVFFDEDSPDEVVRALVRDIVLPLNELPRTESEGIKKMCEGKYSFLCSEFSIQDSPPACPFFKLERPAIQALVFLPLKSNLPYKHLLDRSVRNLLYTGSLAGEVARIFPVIKNSDYLSQQFHPEELSPIMFENVVTIFLCLTLGIFMSVAVLLAEIIYFKRTNRKLKR